MHGRFQAVQNFQRFKSHNAIDSIRFPYRAAFALKPNPPANRTVFSWVHKQLIIFGNSTRYIFQAELSAGHHNRGASGRQNIFLARRRSVRALDFPKI